ncbi:B-cadherin-like [Pholidichthys leucotaenia]
MGATRFAVLGVLLVVFQASKVTSEKPPCFPGFSSNPLVFGVHRKNLTKGMRLGNVNFTDCTDRRRFPFTSTDRLFEVTTDGVLKVKTEVFLHRGHRNFFISTWTSEGRKVSVPIRVVRHGCHHNQHFERHHHGDHGSHHGDYRKHHNRHHVAEVNSSNNPENATDRQLPVLQFPKSSDGLKRRKRDWVIPPLSISENHRGPFPLKVAEVRTTEHGKRKIIYSITGPGADQPPVGLFSMDRDSGILYVTQPLDREETAQYMMKAHAVVEGSGNAEDPMDIRVLVIDQNDNRPAFSESIYRAEVPEASATGFEVMKVVATDADEPNNDNSDIRYRILSQTPQVPHNDMFAINPISGAIRVNRLGLDREKKSEYSLYIQAADNRGEGLPTETKVILVVTDSNDHSPLFTQTSYDCVVEENKVSEHVVTMSVTDVDVPLTAAWNAKFKIVGGDPGGLFAVKTGDNKQEGIVTTAKGLDFEKIKRHTLLIAVENEDPFVNSAMVTSTATVTVDVKDVNEAPAFNPTEKFVMIKEDLAVGETVVQYIATDPDETNQKVMYKITRDPADWLSVDKDTGLIKVKKPMNREDDRVTNDKYTVIIIAHDDDKVPATGTGTVIIQLEDVNDEAPTIVEHNFRVCNKDPVPQLLSVTDKDTGEDHGAPFSVSLPAASQGNWTATMNGSNTGIILKLNKELPSGYYDVVLTVRDFLGLEQDNIIKAEVCDCTGMEVKCKQRIGAAETNLPLILGILGGILLLLMLVLLLLLLTRRKRGEKKDPLLQDDDIRDNIYYYDEEGGGEDDQDYDLSVLHRGLDNRPEVFRNDVVPTFMPAPQYRPRPANPEEIGNFIDDNLKAADNDPTAPPYDSLLVFDYEGGGSDAGSLSSLNSSDSGDQDYDCLSDWGPRFKKLADMYGGGEDDDML